MTGDAGFGMVELLVALAICAVLAMGAGSLISLGLKLRDQVELTAEVQQALLDLRGVSSAVAGGGWVALSDASDKSFRLCTNAPGQSPKLVGTFSLQPNEAEYRSAFAISVADVAVFETQALEYLVVTPMAQQWLIADMLGSARPVAARLKLGLGERHWRMLLWMAQPYPAPPVSEGELQCAV